MHYPGTQVNGGLAKAMQVDGGGGGAPTIWHARSQIQAPDLAISAAPDDSNYIDKLAGS